MCTTACPQAHQLAARHNSSCRHNSLCLGTTAHTWVQAVGPGCEWLKLVVPRVRNNLSGYFWLFASTFWEVEGTCNVAL